MRRIYDAAFELTHNNDHAHLGRFWWIDDGTGVVGQWSRPEAYLYVLNYPGTVYVAEAGRSVLVRAYKNQWSAWVQTVADGVPADNLVTLARRHAMGLVNR